MVVLMEEMVEVLRLKRRVVREEGGLVWVGEWLLERWWDWEFVVGWWDIFFEIRLVKWGKRRGEGRFIVMDEEGNVGVGGEVVYFFGGGVGGYDDFGEVVVVGGGGEVGVVYEGDVGDVVVVGG